MLKCPKCNSDKVSTLNLVLTTEPPQRQYRCEKCKHSFSISERPNISQCKDCNYFRSQNPENFCVACYKTVDPKDSACARYYVDSDSAKDLHPTVSNIPVSRQGWICPKCNKVHSPEVKECSCSTRLRSTPNWIPTTIPDNYNPCDSCPGKPIPGEIKLCGCTLPHMYGVNKTTSDSNSMIELYRATGNSDRRITTERLSNCNNHQVTQDMFRSVGLPTQEELDKVINKCDNLKESSK